MQTEKQYYKDAYERECKGTVLVSGQDEKGCYVVLDRTCFYPEGGGQPSDRGVLGGAEVTDVQEVNGELRHYVSEELEEGVTVTGVIDWARRFDLMQQHSGEHIVSGMIHRKYGYENVGFHMGEEMITIDLSGPLDRVQMEEIEKEANAYIWENHPLHIFLATEEEKNTLPYRSKKELHGEVRLVEIPGADLCACCGTHVAMTGEIGMVKLISVHRFRDGVRMEMLCGKRAFDYMSRQTAQNSQVAVALSVKPENTYQAVGKMQEEIFRLNGIVRELEQERFGQIAARCANQGNVLLFIDGLEPTEIRKCTDEILNICGGICVLLSGSDEAGYKYAAGVRDGDIRELVKTMNQELSGRGGGKPFFAQGSLKANQESVKSFFEEKGFILM